MNLHSPTAIMDHSAFLFDSGASDPISSNLNNFLNWKRLSKPIQIRIGQNSTIPAICIGTILLQLNTGHKLKLGNALYAPRLGCNLLSIGELIAPSSRYAINFDDEFCSLIDKTMSQKTIARCKPLHNMFHLQCRVITSMESSSTSSLPMAVPVSSLTSYMFRAPRGTGVSRHARHIFYY